MNKDFNTENYNPGIGDGKGSEDEMGHGGGYANGCGDSLGGSEYREPRGGTILPEYRFDPLDTGVYCFGEGYPAHDRFDSPAF